MVDRSGGRHALDVPFAALLPFDLADLSRKPTVRCAGRACPSSSPARARERSAGLIPRLCGRRSRVHSRDSSPRYGCDKNGCARRPCRAFGHVSRTLKLTIAYEGTDFAGWQRQASDRTVQAAIEDALLPIEGSRAVVDRRGTHRRRRACGRTSRRACASRQRSPLTIAARAQRHAADRRARPRDRSSGRRLSTRSSRRSARRIATGCCRPVWCRRNCAAIVWHVPQPLDAERMHAAAAALLGPHDFAAFQASGSDVVTTVREVLASRVVGRSGHRGSSAT